MKSALKAVTQIVFWSILAGQTGWLHSSALDLCSDGGRCESRPGYWPAYGSMVFFSDSREMPEEYAELAHDRFLPHRFRFIDRCQPVIWGHMVWLTVSLNKPHIKIKTICSLWC
jgi:hypothetical protein